ADPDRDRPLDRQRVEPGLVDAVVASLDGDHRLAPEAAHYVELLLHPPGAVLEILAERLELDVVPADADAEPEAAAIEHVDLGRLLGDERRLPLRQDDDAG